MADRVPRCVVHSIVALARRTPIPHISAKEIASNLEWRDVVVYERRAGGMSLSV